LGLGELKGAGQVNGRVGRSRYAADSIPSIGNTTN
jgi:hypothetical protein